jgi:hypothetical protein
MGAERMVESRSYYLTDFFHETTLIRVVGLVHGGADSLMMLGGGAMNTHAWTLAGAFRHTGSAGRRPARRHRPIG